ncbi:MAG TPA: hypothetical protein VNX29_00965 [Kaistia sp.]|nr:hypothetical protein [Kaistia sp.]
MKLSAGVRSRSSIAVCAVFAVLWGLVGLPLIWGGAKLLFLGGSPYYVAVGVAFVVTAFLYGTGGRSGLWLLLLTFAATLVWALFEVGMDFWQLVPRLVVPAIIVMLGLWASPFLAPNLSRPVKRGMVASGVVVMVALFGTLWAAFYPHGAILGVEQASASAAG